MSKPVIEPLVNDRVRLRLLEEGDLPMTLAWRNQDHVRTWFHSTATVVPAQHREWFESYRHQEDDFVFVIEETETLKRAVGQASLYHLDRRARRAEFGRLLIGDPDAVGMGLAKLSTRCLTALALGPWDLDEVYLEVKESNGPALSVYRACGFEETGRREGIVQMRVSRSSVAG